MGRKHTIRERVLLRIVQRNHDLIASILLNMSDNDEISPGEGSNGALFPGGVSPSNFRKIKKPFPTHSQRSILRGVGIRIPDSKFFKK